MSFRKFLLMSLLLLAGAFAVWQGGIPSSMSGGNEKRPVLSGVRASEAHRIVAASAETPYALEKSGAGWMLRSPGEGPADEKKVEQLLTTLGSLSVQGEIAPGEGEADGSAYGLAPPELTLTFEGGFGKHVLKFGKKALSGRRYFRIEGDDRTYLVDERSFTALNVEPDSLRDRLPIKFDLDAASELTILRGENDFLRFKRGDGWTVASPAGEIPADSELVLSKLEDLRKLKVKRFVDSPGTDLAAYGLAPPKLIMRIHVGKDEFATENDVTIQAGEGEPEEAGEDLPVKAYYFKVSGRPFVCEAGRPFYNEFLQGPDYFRPRSPLEYIRGKSAERIEMEHEAERFVAVNGPKGWTGESGDPPLDPKLVDELLNEIASIRVLTYPGAEEGKKVETGLPKPAARFKLFLKDRPAPVLLDIGAPVRGSGEKPEGEAKPFWAAMSQEDGTYLPAIVRSNKLLAELKPIGDRFGKKP